VLEELPRGSPVSLLDELGDREFTRAVDADEQVEPFDELRRALPSVVCASAISM